LRGPLSKNRGAPLIEATEMVSDSDCQRLGHHPSFAVYEVPTDEFQRRRLVRLASYDLVDRGLVLLTVT